MKQVLKVELGVLHRGLRGLHLGRVDGHGVLLRLQVQLRDRADVGDRGVHFQLALREIQRRLALSQLGLRGIQLGLIRAWIDREE